MTDHFEDLEEIKDLGEAIEKRITEANQEMRELAIKAIEADPGELQDLTNRFAELMAINFMAPVQLEELERRRVMAGLAYCAEQIRILEPKIEAARKETQKYSYASVGQRQKWEEANRALENLLSQRNGWYSRAKGMGIDFGVTDKMLENARNSGRPDVIKEKILVLWTEAAIKAGHRVKRQALDRLKTVEYPDPEEGEILYKDAFDRSTERNRFISRIDRILSS